MAEDSPQLPNTTVEGTDSPQLLESWHQQRNKMDDPSSNDQPKPENSSEENCCKNCWRVVVQDSRNGTFIGSHPVAFHWLCAGNCVRPICVASVATKIMNFTMLTIVTSLACFFILPWPQTLLSLDSTSIAAFYPCNDKVMRNQHLNGGCILHAGYFMVYRCFFAFGTLMLLICLFMVDVQSTKATPTKTKVHQGFWFYKYFFLIGLLFLYFFFLDGNSDKEGVFEFICSIVGNIANILFTLIALTFVLDVVELWVVQNQTSGSVWADFIYWSCTGIISILDLVLLLNIIYEFAMEQKIPAWEDVNCFVGKKHKLDIVHIAIIAASVGIVVFLIVEMFTKSFFKKRFPYTGWMQVSVIAMFNFLYLWSALYNSPHILSRPRCNWAQEILGTLQDGSKGVYFQLTSLFHAVLAILTLLYFTFVHGPKSDTAPLSVAWYCYISDAARHPVFPDKEDSPEEYLEAIEKGKVWDDESEQVAYSWAFFYFMMTLGGFSIMMSMTNFIDPWSSSIYNSSWISLICKLSSAYLVTLIYMLILISPCCSELDSETSIEKRKEMKLKNKLQDVEKAVAEQAGEIVGIVQNAVESVGKQVADVVNETPAPGPGPRQ